MHTCGVYLNCVVRVMLTQGHFSRCRSSCCLSGLMRNYVILKEGECNFYLSNIYVLGIWLAFVLLNLTQKYFALRQHSFINFLNGIHPVVSLERSETNRLLSPPFIYKQLHVSIFCDHQHNSLK